MDEQRDVIAELAAATRGAHSAADKAFLQHHIQQSRAAADHAAAHAANAGTPKMKRVARHIAAAHNKHQVFLSSQLANPSAEIPPEQRLA
jgi:hypothetical protein